MGRRAGLEEGLLQWWTLLRRGVALGERSIAERITALPKSNIKCRRNL